PPSQKMPGAVPTCLRTAIRRACAPAPTSIWSGTSLIVAPGYDANTSRATALRLPQVLSRHAAVQTIPAAASSAPLTVVQVIPGLQSGGAGMSVVQIAEALVAHGHRAIVVSEGGRLETDIARVGASFVRLPVASKNPSQIVANRS